MIFADPFHLLQNFTYKMQIYRILVDIFSSFENLCYAHYFSNSVKINKLHFKTMLSVLNRILKSCVIELSLKSNSWY